MIHDFISPEITKRNNPKNQKRNLPQIKNKYTPDAINILQISKIDDELSKLNDIIVSNKQIINFKSEPRHMQ